MATIRRSQRTAPDDIIVHRVPEPGIAIDAHGGPTIDPTKNVLDLVRAESKYQDSMREALERYQDGMRDALKEQNSSARLADQRISDFARDAEARLTKTMLDAETRRIDQLAQNRQEFQNTIRDMLAESVRTTSTLVSTQLVQIQATFDTRVSKLEAFQFTLAGRSSVADPQIENAIARTQNSINSLATTTSETMAKMARDQSEANSKLTAALAKVGESETMTKGSRMGRGEVFGWLMGAVVAGGAAATLIGFLVRALGHSGI